MVAVGAGEVLFEEAAGVGVGGAHYVFGGAGGDELAAFVAAFGAEVDDVVGGLDDIQVVFDDKERASGFDERAEGGEEFVDVVEVEAGGRLVEDVERLRARSF